MEVTGSGFLVSLAWTGNASDPVAFANAGATRVDIPPPAGNATAANGTASPSDRLFTVRLRMENMVAVSCASGTLRLNGTFTHAVAGGVNIDLDSECTLQFGGGLHTIGAGSRVVGSGAVEVLAGAVLSVHVDDQAGTTGDPSSMTTTTTTGAPVTGNATASPTTSAPTIVLGGDAGQPVIDVRFDNAGEIRVVSGDLVLGAAETRSSGLISLCNDCSVLVDAAPVFLDDGASIAGPTGTSLVIRSGAVLECGSVDVAPEAVVVANATLAFARGFADFGGMVLTGGGMVGGAGAGTFSRDVEWVNGSLAGPGRILIGPLATLRATGASGGTHAVTDGCSLEVSGRFELGTDVNATGPGGASLAVRSGGTLAVPEAAQVELAGAGAFGGLSIFNEGEINVGITSQRTCLGDMLC